MANKQALETGILTVITENVFFFMKASLFFILSVLPALLWSLLLENSLLDIFVWTLFGPALIATARLVIGYIETDFSKDDFPAFKEYKKFYKENFVDAIKIWLPYMALTNILMINIDAYVWDNATLGLVLNGFYVIIIFLATIIVAQMLLISAKFKFDLKSLFRLSCYYIATTMKSTFGIVATLFLIWIAWMLLNPLIVLILAGPIMYVLVRYSVIVLDDVEERFVEKQ